MTGSKKVTTETYQFNGEGFYDGDLDYDPVVGCAPPVQTLTRATTLPEDDQRRREAEREMELYVPDPITTGPDGLGNINFLSRSHLTNVLYDRPHPERRAVQRAIPRRRSRRRRQRR